MAQRALHGAREQGAERVLASMRIWDDFDDATRGWSRRGKDDAVLRHQHFGNDSLSLSKAHPVNNLWEIQWDSALNFKRSDGGRSSGVYFVALPGNRVVVVKPDDELVSDYCGHMLAHYLGVAQPDMR